jgi:hypothetical protein
MHPRLSSLRFSTNGRKFRNHLRPIKVQQRVHNAKIGGKWSESVKVELKENLCPIWQVPWRSISMRPKSPLLLFQGGKCASNGCLGLDSCRIFLATMFETRYDSFLLKKARSSIESSPPTFR